MIYFKHMRLTRPKTKKDWVRIIFALLALALTIYFCIIRPIQVRYERRQFEGLYTQAKALSKDIESVTGSPDATQLIKDCGRASWVYGGGPLSCWVGVRLTYKNVSIEQANGLLNKAKSPVKPYVKYDGTDEGFNTKMRYDDDLGQDLIISNGDRSCSVRYYYEKLTPPEMTISVGCGGSAMLPHYPLVK